MVDELLTPCGVFTVKKNGKRIPFQLEENSYDTMYIGDNFDIPVHPDGCHTVLIDLIEMMVGDTILCSLDNDVIHDDGGGQDALNSVGQSNGFSIAIGAPDTDAHEDSWESTVNNLPYDINKTIRCLPYDCCHCKGGFEFKVLDDPKQYRDKLYRKHIYLSILWCSDEKEYAWKIVSFLTA